MFQIKANHETFQQKAKHVAVSLALATKLTINCIVYSAQNLQLLLTLISRKNQAY